jgi:hypothetical protein
MSIRNSISCVAADFNSATLTANYQPINTNGFPGPCILLRITNNGANIVDISYDGVNIHDTILENAVLEINFTSNVMPSSYAASFNQGTVVYVKSATMAAGDILVSCYYQKSQQ